MKKYKDEIEKIAEGLYPKVGRFLYIGTDIKRQAFKDGVTSDIVKQMSVDFVEWIVTQKVERIGSGMWEVHAMQDKVTKIVPVLHTKELLTLFLNS